MLFLDGVYVDGADGLSPRFRWVKAPTSAELNHLTHAIARRVGRFLERQGLLERDAENSYLSGDAGEGGPLDQLLGHSMMYTQVRMPREAKCRERPRTESRWDRIRAVRCSPQQTLPGCNEPSDDHVGKVAGF